MSPGNRPDRPRGRLWSAVRELLCVWWRADRVRVSPAESHYFHLQPPCVTLIDSQPVEVLRRIEVPSADGPRIEYDCRTPYGPARLIVTPGHAHAPPVVTWQAMTDENLAAPLAGRAERR